MALGSFTIKKFRCIAAKSPPCMVNDYITVLIMGKGSKLVKKSRDSFGFSKT